MKSTRYWKSFFDKELDLKDTEYRSYYDWDDLLENVKDDYNRNQIKDLLKSMLTIDPKSRPSSQEILNHLWLNGEYNWIGFNTSYKSSVYYCNDCGVYLHGWEFPSGVYEWRIGPGLSAWSSCIVGTNVLLNANFIAIWSSYYSST